LALEKVSTGVQLRASQYRGKVVNGTTLTKMSLRTTALHTKPNGHIGDMLTSVVKTIDTSAGRVKGAGMFRSITFKNFRGFQHLSLKDLGRVNLITGKNNAGKTAILEGLFLLIGPNLPELTLRIHGLRGIHQISALETWDWLFYDRNTDEPIILEVQNDQGGGYSLTLRLTHARKSRTIRNKKGKASPNAQPASLNTTTVKQLLAEYVDRSGSKFTSRGTVTERGVEWERASIPAYPVGFLLTPRGRNSSEDLERYSRLAEIGHEVEVVKALKLIDARIKGLKVLVTGANLPMFYADIGLKHLVPLSLMGDGADRLVAIMSTVLLAKGGTVLIDEIDNGLHYSVMKQVWQAIGRAARLAEVQVFATTHSYECITAAHDAFSEATPYDLRLYRLERTSDGVNVATYDQEILEYAAEMSHEVR
jgi:AAA domain, putative AbiEii toxin, Type IV TA system